MSAINWLSHRPGSENESHGGAFAEFLALPSYKLSVIPPDVSDEAAAAIALVGATAYQALFHLFKLPTNSKILILGGSSAVGAIAIQMAKNNGYQNTVRRVYIFIYVFNCCHLQMHGWLPPHLHAILPTCLSLVRTLSWIIRFQSGKKNSKI